MEQRQSIKTNNIFSFPRIAFGKDGHASGYLPACLFHKRFQRL